MPLGAQKVNTVNYLYKPPPPIDEYYSEEDSYAINEQMGVSDKNPTDTIRRIRAKIKEIEVGTMIITTERVIMYEIGITTATTTSTGIPMVTKMIVVSHMFHLKSRKLLLGMVEVVWHELRICCRNDEEV